MKKLISLCALLFCFLFLATSINAQLTGTLNIPGNYADLTAAITDLNTQGVGIGGVILNVVAANPQTAPLGGYIVGGTGSLVLTTATATDQVIIQGNGNTITAPTPQTSGALNDGIFKLIGADWITITGFTMEENAANTTTTAGTNNMTEWGVALLYVTTTDGAQNNTISNNTIDLNRTYQNTFGIYSNSTHSATAVTTSATATTTAGGNSNLTITGNSVTDVNIGMVVVGPTAAVDQNDGLTIGGSAPNANNITNYGTTGTFSSYANVSGTVNGILVRNTKTINVSFNTVSSSVGGVTSGTLNGINLIAFSNAPTGTFTNSINNNTLSLRSGVAAGGMNGIIAATSTATITSTININSNDFNTWGHTVAASGAIVFISVSGSATVGPLNSNVNGNTFTNMTVNTTGSVTFIANSFTHVAGSVINVNSNSIVTGFTKTGAGGTVFFYDNFGSSPSTVTETNDSNKFSNLTFTGATTISGWRSADGATPGSRKTITNNTFSNITNGAGSITILNVGFSDNTYAFNDVSGNTIRNISGGGNITGITSSAGNQNFFQNIVDPITSTGASAVVGLSITSGTSQKVYKNKIYDLVSNNAGGTVNGILISGGTTDSIYNNLIGNLSAPLTSSATDAVRGISITSTSTLTNINIFYNTVYIQPQSSTGANYSTAAVFHTGSATATTAQLNMRNNIFVNLSTPSGTGNAVAYRRSTATAGTLANYSLSSNNNLFYAGTPGPANLIYAAGTTSTAQTLTAYKNGVFTEGTISPRDAQSVTENPNFLSTTGSSVQFLHIDPTIPTQIESGAMIIASITDDYDAEPRFPNAGYPNNPTFPATAPDIGADEFAGRGLDTVGPVISYTPLGDTCAPGSRNLNDVLITDSSGIASGANAPRVYWRVNSGSYTSAGTSSASSPYDFTIGTAGLVDGDTVCFFVIAQDSLGNISANPDSGLVATNVDSVTSFPTNPNCYVIVCGPCLDSIAPQFVAPTPSCDTLIVGDSGVAITFTVQAQDNSTGPITLDTAALPPGATMTPPVPTTGNPVSSVFSWTPAASGFQSASFTATDSCGNQTICTIRFQIVAPCPDTIAPVFNPPTPICNDVIVVQDTGVAITFTVQADDNSASSITLDLDSLPPGATMTPPLPTTGNPVSSVFNWTPTSYGFQQVTFTVTDSCGNQTSCQIIFDVPLPVELTSFTSLINNNQVTLNWSTATESNNSRFEIERANGNSQEWNKVGTIQGNGNSTQPISYSFVNRGLNVGSYNYRLKQIDFNGNFTYYNLSNEVIIGVPTRFNLSQNYPNPFNPTTKIDFEIPKDGNVNLYVYDNSGKQVSTIVSGFRTAGYYTVQFNATNLASGIYYYKIQYSGDQSFEKVMKMAFLK